jgi:glycosyltransferase involved in cell wall biosynthesis
VIRGKSSAGGQKRVFLNLSAGLDRIGVRYRVNDYRYASANPNQLVCIIGKPFLLDKDNWKNPILFGSAGYSHPVDDPNLLVRRPIRKILVPGPWMKQMCEPHWGDAVHAWPVGIDTDKWQSLASDRKEIDILIYDKVLWDHDSYERSLIRPIRRFLTENKRSFQQIRYGFYEEREFFTALCKCRTMIFLCEHETQGIAYQQALSCGVPIMAWERGGFWRDPTYFPERVIFEPVSSVPYWDDRCGRRFSDLADFERKWSDFWIDAQSNRFSPRDYILENLTLEKCARDYVEIVKSCDF